MWLNLATAFTAELDYANAILCCERLVALRPEEAGVHNQLGWALQEDGRYPEAAACYRRALELSPDHAGTLVNLGILQEELGQMAEAEASFRRAVAVEPEAPTPLARLAMLLRGKVSEAEHAALVKCLDKPAAADESPHPLLFALAHYHDARGEYAEAAAYLRRANPMALDQQNKQGRLYDAAQHSSLVDYLIEEFTPDLYRRLENAGAWPGDTGSRLPVFIFGLPRSGTTLVEQVLASHSRVHGAGELRLGASPSMPWSGSSAAPMAACRPWRGSNRLYCGSCASATWRVCGPSWSATGPERPSSASWTRCRITIFTWGCWCCFFPRPR